jgi:hypothetical protein
MVKEKVTFGVPLFKNKKGTCFFIFLMFLIFRMVSNNPLFNLFNRQLTQPQNFEQFSNFRTRRY